MWPNVLSFILRNWSVLAIAFLALALTVQTGRLSSEKEAHELTKADFKVRLDMAIAAEITQKKEYDDALTSATKRTQTLVEQAKSEAWRNFTARYGPLSKPLGRVTGSVGNIGLCKLPASTATDTAANESASIPDGSSGEPLVTKSFVESCANDAAKLTAWIELCQMAKCEVIP